MSSDNHGDKPAFPFSKTAQAFTEATSAKTTETHAHTTAQHYGLTVRELCLVLMAAGHRAGGLAANADQLAEQAERDADAICARMGQDGAQ